MPLENMRRPWLWTGKYKSKLIWCCDLCHVYIRVGSANRNRVARFLKHHRHCGLMGE